MHLSLMTTGRRTTVATPSLLVTVMSSSTMAFSVSGHISWQTMQLTPSDQGMHSSWSISALPMTVFCFSGSDSLGMALVGHTWPQRLQV